MIRKPFVALASLLALLSAGTAPSDATASIPHQAPVRRAIDADEGYYPDPFTDPGVSMVRIFSHTMSENEFENNNFNDGHDSSLFFYSVANCQDLYIMPTAFEAYDYDYFYVHMEGEYLGDLSFCGPSGVYGVNGLTTYFTGDTSDYDQPKNDLWDIDKEIDLVFRLELMTTEYFPGCWNDTYWNFYDYRLLATRYVEGVSFPNIVPGVTYEIYGIVTDCIEDGETAEIYTDVDDPLTIDQILANVEAYDLLGDRVEVECLDSEKQKYQKDTIGTYTIAVTATDRFGQKSTAYIEIHVMDTRGPVISLTGSLSFAVGDEVTSSDLDSLFEITDNGTSHGGTIGQATYAIDGNPLGSGMTFDADDVGAHTLKVTVADSSGNTSSQDFPLAVVDVEAPQIVMRGGGGSLTIGLSRLLDFDEEDFLALFEATDDVTPSDGIEMGIEGDFIPMKVGASKVTVTAEDASGNVGRLTVDVVVDGDLPPVFILSDTLVGATAERPLSSAEIQTIVTNYVYAGRNVTDVLVDDSDYQENSTTPGSYAVAYRARLAYPDGFVSDETGSLTVTVDESGKEEPSAWERFCRWWTDGWQCFRNWFKGVFTKGKFDCWITDAEWEERFPSA